MQSYKAFHFLFKLHFLDEFKGSETKYKFFGTKLISLQITIFFIYSDYRFTSDLFETFDVPTLNI